MAYNLLLAYKFIKAADMSTTITSEAVETQLQDNIGIQLNWSGAPVGSFTFQVSMDYAVNKIGAGEVTNPGHWTTLTISQAITASGSPDTAYVDFNQLSAPFIRAVYTVISGTGTLDGFLTSKGV